jgi:hypothetical protein
MKEASQAVSPLSKTGYPQGREGSGNCKERIREGVATMREMAEILVRSSQEATKTINARIAATLEEIRSLG